MARYIVTDKQSMGLAMPIDTIFLRENADVTISRVNLDVASSVGLEATGLIASCIDQWKFTHMSHDEQMEYIEKNGFRRMSMDIFASIPDDLSDVVLYIAESTDIPDDGVIKAWKISGKGVE